MLSSFATAASGSPVPWRPPSGYCSSPMLQPGGRLGWSGCWFGAVLHPDRGGDLAGERPRDDRLRRAGAVAIPVVSFGLPILETGISVVRRFFSGQPLFAPLLQEVRVILVCTSEGCSSSSYCDAARSPRPSRA